MNYKTPSSKFEQPLLKPLLEQLEKYFQSIQTKFYIIGATARDMILNAYGEKSGRATRDIDIAVAIPNWAYTSSFLLFLKFLLHYYGKYLFRNKQYF